MIKLVRENRRTKFSFVCDYCHKEISDPGMAMYAWRIDKQTGKIPDGTFYILHKGVCDRSTTDTDTNHAKSLYYWEWMELVEFPGRIIAVMGLTWDRAQGKLDEYKQKDIVKMDTIPHVV